MNTDESVKLLARVDERTILIIDRLDEIAKCHCDHEDRIRNIERWQWKATGISAAICGLGGALGGILFGKGGT